MKRRKNLQLWTSNPTRRKCTYHKNLEKKKIQPVAITIGNTTQRECATTVITRMVEPKNLGNASMISSTPTDYAKIVTLTCTTKWNVKKSAQIACILMYQKVSKPTQNQNCNKVIESKKDNLFLLITILYYSLFITLLHLVSFV